MKSLSESVTVMTCLVLMLASRQCDARCLRASDDNSDVIVLQDCSTDASEALQSRDRQPNTEHERMRQQHATRERAKQTRIFHIQQQIWERLGFGANRRPAPDHARSNSTQISPREFMAYEAALRRTEQLNEQAPERVLQGNDYFAKIYQALRPSCRAQDVEEQQSSGHRTTFKLHFDLDLPNLDRPRRVNRELRVEKADLLLKRKPSIRTNEDIRNNAERGRLEVLVYAYTKPFRNSRRDAKRLISRKQFGEELSGSGTWISVDIQEAVEDWLRRPGKNHGLQVTVMDANTKSGVDALSVFEYIDCNSSSRHPILLNLPSDEEYDLSNHRPNETPRENESYDDIRNEIDDVMGDVSYPYLKLTTAEIPRASSAIRQRRDALNDVNKAPGAPTCIMEKVTISLADLGFGDRVIIPQVFETAYCRGYCPLLPLPLRPGSLLPFLQNGQPVQNSNIDAGTRTCCSPTKLKPLNVLQSDDRGLFITTLDDVIVTECGCRP